MFKVNLKEILKDRWHSRKTLTDVNIEVSKHKFDGPRDFGI